MFAPTRCRIWTVAAVLLMSAAAQLGRCQADAAPGTLIQHGHMSYPPEAKAKGLEGSVKLTGTVGKDGIMRDVRVVSGPEVFRQAAIDAVSSWVYRPYLHDGSPVEVKTTVTVNFHMTEQEKAAAKAAAAANAQPPATSDTPPVPAVTTPH